MRGLRPAKEPIHRSAAGRSREGGVMWQRGKQLRRQGPGRRRGTIFVEYVLLVTLVGLGVIVGLAVVRSALVNELIDLSNAINAINC